MSGLLDLLSGAFNQQPSTEVDPLTVTARPRTPGPAPVNMVPPADPQTSMTATPYLSGNSASGGLDYDNSSAISAIHKVLGANKPQGGSDNPGIYGILPEGLQHGTLRNVLGALGDAFLVGSGRDRQYAPRMQRQEIGDAMAGFDPNNPDQAMAAIQRVAATGAPGAAEMADKLQTSYDSFLARQAQMKYMAEYHQQGIDSRNQSIFQRGSPVAMGVASSAKDANDYAAKYALLDRRAKSIDPNTDAASAFGIPAPEDWQPGMFQGYGMTSNNQQVAADKSAQRNTSMRNTDVNAGARRDAATIGANAHVTAAGMSANKPTASTIVDSLLEKQNRGETLTPAEQALWKKYTTVGGRGSRALPAGLTVGGGTKPPAQNNGIPSSINPDTLPVLTQDQAARLSHNHPGQKIYFKGTDGKVYHN